MKLKQITYSNLKGRSETIELGAANIIYGPNFAGKTSIVDAIKLALLGFHPSLDKTARGVFELSSGEELSVSAILEEDLYGKPPGPIAQHQIGRTWTRRGESVTKKDFVPMGFPETPIVLLDANDYFGRSDRGKVEMMFAAGRMNGSKTTKQLYEETNQFLAEEKDAPWSHVREGFLDDVKSPQEFVEQAISRIEKWRSETAASVKRMAGTLQGVSELQLKEAATPLPEGLPAELKKQQGELEELQRQLREATRTKAQHDATVTPEESEVKEAHREAEGLIKSIADAKAKRSRIENKWTTLLANKMCPTCHTEGDIWRPQAEITRDEEISEVQKEITEVSSRVKELTILIQQKEPESIKKRKKQTKTDQDKIDGLEETIAGVRQDIDKLEKQQQGVMNEAADRKRLAGAKEEHDKYVAQEKQLNAAKKYLLETKSMMVEEMFEPILKVAYAFTKDILVAPLSFRDGELGMQLHGSGQWVPHRTFSGTEQAIAFAALQAALGATAPVKLVIMDELGRIDDENKIQLLENVEKALADGVIDQFIAVDTKLPKIRLLDNAPKGFTLIERKR